MKKNKKLLAGVVFLAGVAALFATPAGPLLKQHRYLVAPEWEIVVVDLSGRPVRGAEVEQSWHHPTLETNLGTVLFDFFQRETKTTNKEGKVSFEQRVKWGNRLMEVAGEQFNRLLFGTHGGGSAVSSVVARKGCRLGWLVYTPRLGLENTLVLDDRMSTPECR